MKRDVSDKGESLIVRFRWTKTIQYGERNLDLPLIQMKTSFLCPVQAYRNMCKKIILIEDSPLFVLPNKKFLKYMQFLRKLKHCIKELVWVTVLFLSIVLGEGGATLAFQAKVTSDKIKMMGDWKSDC